MFANKVMMVRPVDFAFNSETGEDNEFQQHIDLSAQQIREGALTEFSNAVEHLKSLDIEVMVLEKTDKPQQTPDAVFPNNWFATDVKGNIYLFPMKTLNRRREVRLDEVKQLLEGGGVSAVGIINVEQDALILEGTGAIVFDHANKLAYAALSERCHESLLNQFCKQIGYQPVSYSTCSSRGHPIYHTNVVMAVGEDFVVSCVESIVQSDRQYFVDTVQNSGKTLVEISLEQMELHYCGNILELHSRSGQRVLALSQRAWLGFTEQQQAFFESRMTICANDITTIETIGGGSMRCMLAEVFNPDA
jgi:hypothetical protein